MKFHSITVSIAAFCALSVVCQKFEPGRQRRSPDTELDMFKMWGAFPKALAVTDPAHPVLLECGEGARTAIDPNANTVVYDVRFPQNNVTVQYRLKASDTPGVAFYTFGEVTTPMKSTFYYTDYKNCAIQLLNYKEDDCVLWIRKEGNSTVPQSCVDRYYEACGVRIPENSTVSCSASGKLVFSDLAA